MPKSKSRKKRPPKRVLALPDLEHATAVLNSLTPARGQRTYNRAIREFVDWYCSEPRLSFNRTVVLDIGSTEGSSNADMRRPSIFGGPPSGASHARRPTPASQS